MTPDRRNRRSGNPRLEMAITVFVLVVVLGTLAIFLFVYHDFPLRVS